MGLFVSAESGSDVWVFFFFYKLIRIPVRKLWCDYLPDVQKKIVEDEVHLGGILRLSIGFTEHLVYARCTPSADIFDATMSTSGCSKSRRRVLSVSPHCGTLKKRKDPPKSAPVTETSV